MKQIFVYSGNDIVSSRKGFIAHQETLKSQGLEVAQVLGKDLTAEKLKMLSSPTTLFGQKRALAIEELLGGRKSKEQEKVIEEISSVESPIVIWEGKDFSRADQAKFPRPFIFKNFKLPEQMFKFLGSIEPGKKKENVIGLRTTLESVEPGFLFLMLVRQARMLVLAKDGALGRMPPWQQARIKKQAACFELNDLKKLYRQLLKIDYQQKTSSLPFDLSQMLELLMCEL
jgi:DNA polymerase III delta subunit